MRRKKTYACNVYTEATTPIVNIVNVVCSACSRVLSLKHLESQVQSQLFKSVGSSVDCGLFSADRKKQI